MKYVNPSFNGSNIESKKELTGRGGENGKEEQVMKAELGKEHFMDTWTIIAENVKEEWVFFKGTDLECAGKMKRQ